MGSKTRSLGLFMVQFALAILIAILLVIIIAPALAVIPPLIFFQVKYLKRPDIFELSGKEMEYLRNAESQIPRIANALELCLKRGEGLNRNVNGDFDRRNRLGKDLNEEIWLLSSQYEQEKEVRERLRKEPFSRIVEWINVTSARDALLGGFFISLIALIYSTFFGFNIAYQPKIALSTGVSILAFYLVRKKILQSQKQELIIRCKEFANVLIDEPSIKFEESTSESDDNGAEQPQNFEWYTELGIAKNATRNEIIEAYKMKIAQNHPDKVAHMDEKFRRLAEEASRKLNWARDEGLRQVGELD